jgi:putative SOS response-associated peptidase YedK
MCNAYTVRAKVAGSEIDALISAGITKLRASLVRRTGRGVVVRAEGGGLVAETMRWGFRRPFSEAINNARSDNLHSPIWKEAVAERRCLVPISTFYEWQPLPLGGKQAYEFRRPDEDWLWVAGLFEPDEVHGRCYATMTTEPPEWVMPIHDRLLAIVSYEDGMRYLNGDMIPSLPYEGKLLAEPCESPLKKRANDGQGELF